MSDVRLSGDAAVVANMIRSLDRELDEMEQQRQESITGGMRAPLMASIVVKWSQDSRDDRYRRLLEERATLVALLNALVDGAEAPTRVVSRATTLR